MCALPIARVGPGVFFTLFGATILGLSLHYGIAYSQGGGEDRAAVVYSGIGDGVARGPPPSRPDPVRVTNVLVTLERLNRAAASLDPGLDAFSRGDRKSTRLNSSH